MQRQGGQSFESSNCQVAGERLVEHEFSEPEKVVHD